MKTIHLTYEQWKRLGFNVIQGSKAKHFTDGLAMFSELQVTENRQEKESPEYVVSWADINGY